MPYNKTNWQNTPSTATPLSAANLNKLETQYEAVVADIGDTGTALGSEVSTAIAGEVEERAGRVSLPRNVSRLFPGYLSRWQAGVRAVLEGSRDAKLLIVGDSTAGGVGGGSASSFIQAASWPSKMVPLLDRVVAPAAHGLAVPPSNSGALTPPYDTRWSLGAGWAMRGSGATDGYVGFGGKGTNIRGGAGSGPLVFNDSRIRADRFDVWVLANAGATGADFTIQATGGAVVSGKSYSQPESKLVKVTVSTPIAATTHEVTINITGGTGALYVVGIEPWLSTARRVRVANAGISGSNSTGWVTLPAQNAPWHGVGFIREYAPDLTIIDLGINDADPAGLTPPATYAANIAALVRAASVSGDVLIKSMIPSDATRYDHEALLVAELAKLGLPMVDVFGYYGVWDAEMMSDAVHGNAAMYTDEADLMAGVLYQIRPVTSGPFVDPSAPYALPAYGFTRRFLASAVKQDIGTDVASWGDVINATTLATGSGRTAPTLVNDGGRLAIEFDGVADGLGQAVTRNQPHTIAVVVKPLTTAAGAKVIVGGGSSSPSRGTLFWDGTGWRANAGATANPAAVVTTEYHVVIVVFNGASSSIMIDGVDTTGLNVGTENTTMLNLGFFQGSTPSGFANMRMVEAIFAPSALDATQRENLHAAIVAGNAL